jgi:hypothetical protein
MAARGENNLIPYVCLDDITDQTLVAKILSAIERDDYSEIDYLWDHSGAGYNYYYPANP